MKYRLNEDKVFADITDNVAIIINSETAIYYSLNELGTYIFENITSGVDTDTLIEEVKKFNNSQEVVDNLDNFVKELLDYEILLEGNDLTSDLIGNITDDIVIKDGFNFVITPYNDAEELLLVDPIHDVKDETGWNPTLNSLEDNEEKLSSKKTNEQQVLENRNN